MVQDPDIRHERLAAFSDCSSAALFEAQTGNAIAFWSSKIRVVGPEVDSYMLAQYLVDNSAKQM